MKTNASKLTLGLIISLVLASNIYAVTLSDFASSGQGISETYDFDIPSTATVYASVSTSAAYESYASGTILWIVPGYSGPVLDVSASGNNADSDYLRNLPIPFGVCTIVHVGTTNGVGSSVSLYTDIVW